MAEPARTRLGVLERPGTDFPYYAGEPVTITGGRWWVVVAAVAAGFASLTLIPLTGVVTAFIPTILFTGLPLAALIWAARGHWKAIFRRVGLTEIGTMLFYLVLNLLVSVITATILSGVTDTHANPNADALADMSTVERIMFYPRTAIQLFGEELLTILPFLALLYWLYNRVGMDRRKAVIVSWIATAVMFGALHLPTYDWNVIQAVVGIGIARIVLTAAYLRTKNIWVSTGTHILNDWVMFTLAGH
ncbi:CAAX amino protease [Actinorhabdospora filicis]|uniref:CAAX amino protease n=1 Tax=Actinorhabdospora filicis TaxID=1785913 RepID=A0A9W6SHM6_9ACTN|nr:type II CAAX endopeptidase family protein [Actinorhabdospora filicis]GLZ76153.1 CAAX amino protease [Actinorhabdospora filicis]